MGKTRKHKTRFAYQSNPLGMAPPSTDSDDAFAFEDELKSAGPVEAIRDQLQNSNIEEKLTGLQSLAVLAASKDKVAAICRSELIRIAAPLLCEREQSVRNAAAGSLRNLSVCGPDVCELLVEQDVLTPLLALLSEYTNDPHWMPTFDASLGGQLDLRSDVFLQGINLLWNLCESTSVALDMVNQTQLLAGLVRCLDFKVFGQDIAISVAQCLLVVSENNPKSWNILNQNVASIHLLLKLDGDHGHTFLRTLAAGILANAPALSAAYTDVIHSALSHTLDTNTQVVIYNLMTSMSTLKSNGRAPELEIKMDTADEETEEAAVLRRRRQELPTDFDIAVKDVCYLLDAQRLAAEIITNMCSADEEEWLDAEDDDVSENESVTDYETIKSSSSSTNLDDGDRLPIEFVEAIKSMATVSKLWQRAQPLDDNVSQQLRANSVNLLMKVKNLRISSLLCLQNLCNNLSPDDLGGDSAIYNVWVDVGQQVFKGPQDVSILEPSTSLMRSALVHLKTNRELFSQMTKDDLELILDGVNNCTMAEIRANWLRMLGTLGCLLSDDLVKIIIAFIMQTCLKEMDVWTISEAMDALMDMFSDNDWNQIVIDLNLTERIKEVEKLFKTKVRQQRRELKERYPAVQTVRTNLSRFVIYMEEQSLKFSNGSIVVA